MNSTQSYLLAFVIIFGLTGCFSGRVRSQIVRRDLGQSRKVEEVIGRKNNVLYEERYYSGEIMVYRLLFDEFSHWDTFQKGERFLNDGNYRAALTHFEQAVAERPDNPMLHFKLGVVYERLNRPKEALIRYEAAADRHPHDDGLAVAVGNSLLNLQKPQKALKLFNQVLERRPQHLGARFGQALAYYNLGDKTKAGAGVASILKAYPKFTDAKVLQDHLGRQP